MGLYKLCTHKGRARDRCSHTWWGSFKGKRVSLARWANREVESKAEADVVLGELKTAIRAGTFDERELNPPPDTGPMTFRAFAEVYKKRHVTLPALDDHRGARHRDASWRDARPALRRHRRQARRIVLRGATTKSRKTRVVPIGTTRLMAVLEWLRLDAEGGRKPDEMLVFSNEVGEPFKTFKRAWTLAVLKAHGVDPRWRKGSYKDLAAASLQRLREVDLHWHDIRHEYASRLVEKGVPLAPVRDLLGHASILTTERYDNQKMEALQAAVERLETGKTFDPARVQPDSSAEALSNAGAKAGPAPKRPNLQGAKAGVSSFFQDGPASPRLADRLPPTEAS